MVSHAEVSCSLHQFPTETSSFLCTTPVSKPLHAQSGQTLCIGGGQSSGQCLQAGSPDRWQFCSEGGLTFLPVTAFTKDRPCYQSRQSSEQRNCSLLCISEGKGVPEPGITLFLQIYAVHEYRLSYLNGWEAQTELASSGVAGQCTAALEQTLAGAEPIVNAFEITTKETGK